MQTIGHIDLEKFSCIASDITTDEVIITEERIKHIRDRHPGDYEIVCSYLPEVLVSPDYILEDKSPNTALILKAFEENGLRIQVILRLHTPSDTKDFKNSIISAWRINESRWKNYIGNKKILYKRE